MGSAQYDQKLLQILDSACSVFAEKGFHNTSVRDVASATGVSPAGLYYYFKSKEELLHLVLETCLGTLVARIRRNVASIEDPAARLRAIIETHLRHFHENRSEMRVLVREWDTLSGAFGAEIRGLMREYAKMVIRTFRDLSPERPSKELRAAAFGLFGMLTWVDQWYQPERDLPLDLLAEQFSSIFLRGFLSPPPKRAGEIRAMAVRSTREWSKQNAASSILSGPGF